MIVEPCRPYHARTVGRSQLRMHDGRSVFKVYYVSILGRDRPERFEWQRCGLARSEFESRFQAGSYEGVGFVVAFPHITKVFRFSPHAEAVLDVAEYETVGLVPKDGSRGDGTHEFACLAESAIAAEEHDAWARATSVDEYLVYWSGKSEFLVVDHAKLGSYWVRTGTAGSR
jgi:hypothetical protein